MVRQRVAAHGDAVLALEAPLQHVELQHAHDADDDALHAHAKLAEDLDGALLGKLLHALDELLALEGVDLRDAREVLRRERGNLGKLHVGLPGAHGVTDGEDARVEQAHDVAGVRLVHDGAVVCHHRGAGRQLDGAVALHVVGAHATLELARADAHERDAVAMVAVHVRLDLEHKAAELGPGGLDLLAGKDVRIGQGLRRKAQEVLQERLHAKVRECRPKEHGRQAAGADRLEVELVVGAVQKLDVVHQGAVVFLADELVQGGVAQLGLDLAHLLRGVGVAVALERDHVAGVAVEHAAEVAAAADGPVHGVRADAQHRLDLLRQVKGVAGVVVQLVHEREDGDVAQRADLEELLRLGLDALCAVDHHDRGVRRHERAVRVLGKVLVARGVKNVDALALVRELQHGRRDRDAALLLDVHPVGHGVARARLALHRAGGLDAAGVQQQLLGKGGLARVGVADDGERSPRCDLVGQAWHAFSL